MRPVTNNSSSEMNPRSPVRRKRPDLPGSAFPGERGNAIVSAHRDRHFRSLDELAIGDTIITQTRHNRVMWRVSERRVVTASAPVIRGSSDARLTLTTCWPVRYLGPAPDRLIITAVALSGASQAPTQ